MLDWRVGSKEINYRGKKLKIVGRPVSLYYNLPIRCAPMLVLTQPPRLSCKKTTVLPGSSLDFKLGVFARTAGLERLERDRLSSPLIVKEMARPLCFPK